jgi:hypothetical protein
MPLNPYVCYETKSEAPLTLSKTHTHSRDFSKDRTKYDVELTALNNQLDFTDYDEPDRPVLSNSRLIIAKVIAGNLDIFEDHLPIKQPTIKVLSLACGNADEFLPIAAFLKHHNPDCKLDYVGIDIDKESNQTIKNRFKNFPNVAILDGDCSNLHTTFNTLAAHKSLPEQGFDVIFLRHPDVNGITRGKSFKKMIEEVIPGLAAKNCVIIFSTYFDFELQTIGDITKRCEYAVAKKNFIETNSGGITCEGDSKVLDKYCYLAFYAGLKSYTTLTQARDSFNLKDFVTRAKALIPPLQSGCQPILDALYAKDFSRVIIQAVSQIRLGLVKMILQHKELIYLDINHSSSDNLTVLDLADTITSDEKTKVLLDAIKKLLVQHGAIKQADKVTNLQIKPQ